MDHQAAEESAGLHANGDDGFIGREQFVPAEPTRLSAIPSLPDVSSNTSFTGTPNPSWPMLTSDERQDLTKEVAPSDVAVRARPVRRRWQLWGTIGVIAAIIIIPAIVLPVVLVRHNNKSGGGGAGANSPTSTSNPESPSGEVTGGNGSLVTTEDGVTFTYVNSLGGFCKSL